jgi:hypothetical protein
MKPEYLVCKNDSVVHAMQRCHIAVGHAHHGVSLFNVGHEVLTLRAWLSQRRGWESPSNSQTQPGCKEECPWQRGTPARPSTALNTQPGGFFVQ